MNPVGSPEESATWVRALLADAGELPARGAAGELDLAVDARDEMLEFLVVMLLGDRERALYTYFQSGLSIAGAMTQVLRWRFGDLARVGKVLDFASGYGRVTRFLLRDLPAERVWVSDVYAGGVRFQQERFGVHGIVSTVEPEELACAERFDAILVTSLFTHLPEQRFVAWLRRLMGLLAPGGILAFSVHDQEMLAPGLAMPAAGILFQELSESGSLATHDYGSSWVSEAFVRGAVARAAGAAGATGMAAGTGGVAASVHRLPKGLCNFQDLYLVVPEPDADFGTLGFRYDPYLFVERCVLADGDRLDLSGWACVLGCGRLREVEVVVDDQLLATLPITDPRHDVADRLGDERFLLSGWGGACRLPAGASPTTSLLRLRVVDDRGVRFPVQASRLASAQLDSARLEVTVLQRCLAQAQLAAARAGLELEGLRARIAAMEASRFWKLRNRWFQLKRALGWTSEA
jgi:SAM-dependent methyltransferase